MEKFDNQRAEAQSFMVRAVELVGEIKAKKPDDKQHKRICDSVGYCLARCYTLEETQTYVAMKTGLDAASVKWLFDGIITAVGIAGGEAYLKHSLICSQKRSKAEQPTKDQTAPEISERETADKRETENPDMDEERRLSGLTASCSGRKL